MRDLEKPGETPGGRGTETPSLREGESRGQKKQKKRRHQSKGSKDRSPRHKNGDVRSQQCRQSEGEPFFRRQVGTRR